MRVRLLALLSAAALFGLAAIPASATSEGHGYLALGDSVAFGTSPLLDPSNAATFIGYPDIVAKHLNIEDVNAACPGEATGGFIDPQGLDNVCRPYHAAFPLHVTYTGTQLAFAVDYLRANPRTRLVTLNLDANDFFRLTSGPGTPWPPSTCLAASLAVYFSTCAVENLETIFATIRKAGYTGLIVALTYYALDYSNPTGLFVSSLLNGAMETAAANSDNVRVASGFDAWKPVAEAYGGSSCAAGLLIALPGGGCDIHPSPAGRDLLAKAIVNAIAASCPAHKATGCLNRDQQH